MTFEQDVIVLGREAGCDLPLTRDAAVSSTHALIAREATGWTLKDLGSKNGVHLESPGGTQQVGRTIITGGMILSIGRTRLRVDLLENDRLDKAEVPATGKLLSSHPGNRLLLRVLTDESVLKFQIISQGAVGTLYTMPFAKGDVSELLARLSNLMRSFNCHEAGLAQGSGNGGSDALGDYGKFLASHFIPARVRERLCESKATELLLILDPDIIHFPWELAVIGDLPLSLRFSVGRQVTVEDHRTVYPEAGFAHATRMLVVSTPTEDLPDAYAEAQNLFHFLQSKSRGSRFGFLAGSRVERVELLRRMAGSEIVYFVGHAQSDERTPMNSGWFLKDGRITCADFRSMAHPPTLVFANGCETGREIPQDGCALSQGAAYGMASGLILSGVQNYLGAIWEIDSEAAGKFARIFFTHLLEGASIGDAVRLARMELMDTLGKNNPVWASYILYGNPSRKFA